MLLGVLLAAGTGSRFDAGNKLVTDLDGEPLVTHAARALLAAPVDEVVAIVGYEKAHVSAALESLPIGTVSNPDYAQGQSTSVRCGVAVAQQRGATAVLFALGDMPAVAPETYRAIVDAYHESGADVVVPTFKGTRGNPVLFDGAYLDRFADLSGDSGGRQLFDHANVHRVECDDPGILTDVDSIADLEAVRHSDR